MHFLGFPQERALLLTTTVPPHPLYTASSPALNLVKKKKNKKHNRIFHGYSRVTFIPCLLVTALETERNVCARRGGAVKAGYHFFKVEDWCTSLYLSTCE